MRSVLPLRHLPFVLLLLLLLAGGSREGAEAAPFICNATAKALCRALLGYVPPNATTYAAVKSLFQVRSLRSLIGDNGLPLSTHSSAVVHANSTIRVRFPCSCSNGTGVSARNHPIYKVKAGDGLDAIARNVFDGFVTYQDIAAANKIADPDKIEVGQKLWIPLPCSCDPVDGAAVVHYAHLVAAGSSVEGIAAEFGTDEATLLRLNGISDPTKLLAGQVLDVPLRACSSSISNKSADHRLLLTNNSYTLTAKDCVLCSCSSSSWQLNCQPTTGRSSSTCPPAKCGSLYLGNSSSISACESTTCAYTGYTSAPNFTILTNLTTLPLCNNGSAPQSQPSGSSAPGSNWMELFITIHMALLCFSFLWRGKN
ncbi:chitin elicitor-binding protein [Elaeis guineensis]|uniref:Chitin elicitor-binding protein n=1 Tax=Elaeis guineensis var. tenera TaxID=51953 RepID=A0A6I9RZT8_ELAGV|nr:chitin elicitor-binding protein [Elaeis guineensis]